MIVETIVTTMMAAMSAGLGVSVLYQMCTRSKHCPSVCHLVWPMERRLAVAKYAKLASYKYLRTYTDEDTGEQYVVFENPLDSITGPTRMAVGKDYTDESFIKTRMGGAA